MENFVVAAMVLLFICTVWYYERETARLRGQCALLAICQPIDTEADGYHGADYDPAQPSLLEDPVLAEAFKASGLHVGHVGRRVPGRPEMFSPSSLQGWD